MNKCLLVKIKGGHKYLVSEGNLSSLLEFLKTFQAEVYRVKLIEGKVLPGLKALANAICNQDYKSDFKAKKLKKVFPVPGRRKATLKNAKKVREFIEKRLLAGKPLALRTIKNRYQSYSYPCLCNHFSAVRKKLADNGCTIAKVGQGAYCLSGCTA
jgi:hypothetical protein